MLIGKPGVVEVIGHQGTLKHSIECLSVEEYNEIMKTSKQLERHLKGLANHRRLDILFLINRSPGLTLENISEKLECGFATLSVHTQKLVQAGLLEKKYVGRTVSHTLSPYGKKFLKFIATFK